MTRTFAVLVILGLLVRPTFADPDNKSSIALEILKKASAAAEGLTAISFEATVYGEGELADRFPTIAGNVVAARGTGGQGHRISIEGSALPPDAIQASPFSFVSDGENVYSLDGQMKTFTSGRPNKTGIRVSNRLLPPRYLEVEPFKDVIESRTAQYEGQKTVEGVACSVIGVTFKGSWNQVSRLYLGKDDFLLRRMERAVSIPTGPGRPPKTGTIVFAATSLNTKPKLDNVSFKLECPEGFEKKEFASPQQPGQSGLLPVGSDAPNWELKTPDGRTVTLKGLRGKVVVLDFWATWCGPCKMAMPGLQKLHDRFKGKPVAIYGVNCRERRRNADPMAYIKTKGFTYPQLLNGDAVANAYRVGGIPCFYIIGPDGKILDAHAGFNPRMDELAGRIIEGAAKQ